MALFTLFVLMDSSILFDIINFGWSIIHILRSHRFYCNFPIISYFFSLKIVFVLGNGADPDEILHLAAFNLGLHYFVNVLIYGYLVRV